MSDLLRQIRDSAIREDAEIKYLFENGSLRMDNHPMPLSIKQDECDYLTNFIAANNLQRGYEVATAFGVSTVACGLGFKQTGGRMVTMDAYIEERFDSCTDYRQQKGTYEDADGFKSVRFLLGEFDLEDVVTPTVGWSPDDTEGRLSQVFDLSQEKLDFVFIDALHYDEAVIADVKSILPFLADKHAIFFHDVHCFGIPVQEFLMSTLGGTYSIIPQCRYFAGNDRGGYNLALLNNL